ITDLGNNQKIDAHYYYDENGNQTQASRTMPDGSSESFSKKRNGDWQKRTTGKNGEDEGKEPVSNVTFNADGGMSYDSGKAHITVEGYGAKHVKEDTNYGSYEQDFDPSGKLTTVIRKDNNTGKTELLSVLSDGKGSLLTYDTNNPDNFEKPQDVTVKP